MFFLEWKQGEIVFLTDLGWILNSMKKCTWPQKFRENHRTIWAPLYSLKAQLAVNQPQSQEILEETTPSWYSEFFFRKLSCGSWSNCGVFISFVMTCKRDSGQFYQHGMFLLSALGVMGELYPFPVLVVTSKILQAAGGAGHILVSLLWLVWTIKIFLTKPKRTQHSALSFWQPQGWQHRKTNRGFHILS